MEESEIQTESSAIVNEAMLTGELSDRTERMEGVTTGTTTTTPATVAYHLESSDDIGKMQLPHRARKFKSLQGLPGEEPARSYTQLIKGRPPKQLKTIPRSAFRQYDENIQKAPYKCRPELLVLQSQYITEVTGIEKYFHVKYLDLTYNKITNDGLRTLRYMQNLVTLILDHNKIIFTIIPILRNLEYLSLNRNLLKRIDKFDQPNLQHVFLNENQIHHIKNVDERSLPKLVTLSICRCLLVSMRADYAPTLSRLYLNYNNLNAIEGISHLVNLETLHLRGNQIDKITGFSPLLKKLFYVNLRENLIDNKMYFKRLKMLPLLRIFIISDNPIAEELGTVELRHEILLQIPEMRRINKELVEEEEEMAARIRIAKIQAQQERRRLRREQLGEGEGEPGEGDFFYKGTDD